MNRCEQEQRRIIAEVIEQRSLPTGAQCLGYFDWEMEKGFIAKELLLVGRSRSHVSFDSTEAKSC